jgi:hypothetical protein
MRRQVALKRYWWDLTRNLGCSGRGCGFDAGLKHAGEVFPVHGMVPSRHGDEHESCMRHKEQTGSRRDVTERPGSCVG